jgi:sulfatase modifying factor 1
MTPPAAAMTLEGMRRLAGGSFLMGCEDFYPEEGPLRRVEVEGFCAS